MKERQMRQGYQKNASEPLLVTASIRILERHELESFTKRFKTGISEFTLNTAAKRTWRSLWEVWGSILK